ncbi:hypothetical protein NIES3974_30100 [Calothrix sp. NIES-3974]|nr:hypothetical protein NIES3974_30100 [Calothrix sp. NIES-3974]
MTTSFPDTQNHWARDFIHALAARGIIVGFPNGTFRPDNSITRAEFATMLAGSFRDVPKRREYRSFLDVPGSFWGARAIQLVYEQGFMIGYPDNRFRPDNRLTRIEALVALVSGLNLAGQVQADLLTLLPQIYEDAAQIPGYGRTQVAVATRAKLITSFPNTKLLNPNLAATRADVATFVHQALAYLNQIQKVSSPYIILPPGESSPITPPPSSPISVSHNREFRGAWVSTVWNIDFPSKSNLPVEEQKAEFIKIANTLQRLNFNALILQVRPEGDAVYASSIEPWSRWLTGTQGQAPTPFYDPLEFAIAECRKRNIQVHAWFNPYRAKVTTNQGNLATNHLAVTNPECVYRWGNTLWMDPGIKLVQDRVYQVVMDVVRRYDVDGIHLDDYFYPYPISGQNFPDDQTYAAYRASGGRLDLADWRRQNVDQMVQRLYEGIKAVKPHVSFGVSPFGIYRPGQPPGIVGLDAYNVLYADAKKWLEEGWVDYLAPQLYWRIDQTQQSYPTLLRWWTQINTRRRYIFAGNNLGKLDDKDWKDTEIEKQVQISRSLAAELSLGNIFFSVNAINENRQGIANTLGSKLYNRPALPPQLSWHSDRPPTPPSGLDVKNRRLEWNPANTPDIRSWTLYRRNGNTWELQRILSRGTHFATVQPGTYAVCAVDRFVNESAAVQITVS